MKISILLPYKENFSPNYPGAVSIFLKDIIKNSRYKKNILVFGNTKYRKKLLKSYKNLVFKRSFLKSSSKLYLNKFIDYEKKNNSDLIEVHNRPDYINTLFNINENIVLYFHNNPIHMKSSNSLKDRINLISKTKKIIFNSKWTKKKFINGLKLNNSIKKKLEVIYQSTNIKKVNFSKKENLIIFVGRLNSSKGYDIFGKAVIKILEKYPDWKAIVIGDEPREKITFNHKRLDILGFLEHNKVSNWFIKSQIAVVCSRWEEPFGRTALEAASSGCAVIISNSGGLPEAAPNAIKINNLSVNSVKLAIEKLIKNKIFRNNLQKESFKKFYLTNSLISKKIDKYRNELIKI
tara:strand:- start:74 stop:1120 length:1047 start_codon:yes stop_codon:yes gene_type:complete